jgi:hypothetical protein
MLWKLVTFVVGSMRDQTLCGESAAFLKDIMIRDIMIGRYLRPDVSHVNEKARVERKAYTTMPLLTVKKSMIIFF